MIAIEEAPAILSGEVLGYVDDPPRRYVEGMKLLLNANKLRRYLAKWPFLAADAIAQAVDLTDADVQDLQKNRGVEAEGERIAERYGAILVPARMLTLSILSNKFKAPAGAVYIRLWESGEHDRLMELPEAEK